MNRRGITAFLDAMIFLVVIMMAISVGIATTYNGADDGPDPDDFLAGLSSVEIRLSDMTDIQDDSLSYVSDIMAYSLNHECAVEEYLKSVLDSLFGENRYCLRYEYGGSEKTIGDPGGFYPTSSERTMKVSTGGDLIVHLGIR